MINHYIIQNSLTLKREVTHHLLNILSESYEFEDMTNTIKCYKDYDSNNAYPANCFLKLTSMLSLTCNMNLDSMYLVAFKLAALKLYASNG